MIKNNNKGFTLIELLVVVLIIGILAAMAMPQYFKAMERSRMTEAVTMLASIAQAQQRKYMQTNAFATNYNGLNKGYFPLILKTALSKQRKERCENN